MQLGQIFLDPFEGSELESEEEVPVEYLRETKWIAEHLGDLSAILRNIGEIDQIDSIDEIERPPFGYLFDMEPFPINFEAVEDSFVQHGGNMRDETAMLRTLIYARACNLTRSKVHDRLDDNPELAQKIGFDTLPDQSTIYRASTNRFKIDGTPLWESEELNRLAERCIYLGLRKGFELPTSANKWFAAQKGIDPSEPTLARADIEDRVRAVKSLLDTRILPNVLPHLGLRRSYNTSHDLMIFYGLLAKLARDRWHPESGSELASYELDTDFPSRQNLHNHIRKFELPDPDVFHQTDQVELIDKFDRANNALFEIAADEGFLDTDQVAIDTTNWRWYGEEAPWNVGVEPKDNTHLAWQFISTALVNTEGRFVVGTQPVTDSGALPELSEELLTRIQSYTDPNIVYFDNEFYNGDIIRICRNVGINFLIPAEDRGSPGKAIDHVKNSSDSSTIIRNVDFSDLTVNPDVLAVQAHPDAVGNKNNDQVRGYLTDFSISNIDPDAEALHYGYNDRWAIEDTFDSIKNKFMPITESPDIEVRVFYFLTGMLFYNMHRLIRLLLQNSQQQNGEIYPTGMDTLTALIEIGTE